MDEKRVMVVGFAPKLRRVTRDYKAEDTDFSPYDKVQLSDAAKNQIIGRRNQVISKHNTAAFYVYLCHALFGGEVLRNQINGNSLRESQGKRLFCPDVERVEEKGTIYTEVKSVSVKNSNHHCSARQLENYFGYFLNRLSARDRLPGVEYAFFRYSPTYVDKRKKKNKRKPKGRPLHLLSNKAHFEKLCRDTQDLLVVPLNLAFFIFLNSKPEIRNQESSDGSNDKQKYFRPIGEFLTYLKRGKLDEVRSRKFREAHFGLYFPQVSKIDHFLMLDELQYQTFSSSHVTARLFADGEELEHRVRRFPVHVYSMPEDAQREWNKWLKRHRNREKIYKAVGIGDPLLNFEF